MKRRHFLAGAAAAASASLWPDFLRRAFAGSECAEGDLKDLAIVSAALRSAQRSGKPLLVLVIPKSDSAKYERGRDLGELLNYGGEEAMAALALVEVVCATTAHLKQLVPAASGAPTMFLVDPSQVPAAVRPLDIEPYRERIRAERRKAGKKEQKYMTEDQVIDQRIALMTRLLTDEARLRDPTTLAALASRARASLDKAELAELDAALKSSAVPPPTLVERGAAILALESLGGGARAAEWRALLASSAKARLTGAPPSGSRWATSYGCGTRVDGEEPLMMACGMGHIATRSQRFLYLFAKTPGEELAEERGEYEKKKVEVP